MVKMSALLAKRSGELVKRSGELVKGFGEVVKGSGEVTKRSGKIAKGSGEVAKRQSTRLCKPGSITILPQDRWSRNTLYKKRKSKLVKNLVIKKRQMLYCCY